MCAGMNPKYPLTLSLAGPGGLAEAPAVAGGPPGREVRRVGAPASDQAHPPLPVRLGRVPHQDCLVSPEQSPWLAVPLS